MSEFSDVSRRGMLLAACGIVSNVAAQSVVSANERGPVNSGRMAGHLQRYLKASGERLTKPGKERVQSSGLIEVGSASGAPIQWVREFPGKLKVDGLGKNLVFDLDKTNAAILDDLDEEILETLSNDTEDAFFQEWVQGNQGRFLGANFAVQGAAGGFGSRVDIYEMAMPVAARKTKGVSVKHFMFDNQSGYLHKIAYVKPTGGLGTPVVTELSNYSLSDGVPVARRVYRGVNKAKRFQIQVNAVALGAQAADGVFATGK